MKGYWKIWFKAAGVRALKTVAQTAIATLGTAFVLEDVNWWIVCSASLLAGVLSLLTSLAGIPEVEKEVKEEEAKEPKGFDDDLFFEEDQDDGEHKDPS